LLVEVKGPPVAVADLMQEIDARIRHGTDDDATLVLTDLRHRLDRYQQKLAPKAASPHLQEAGSSIRETKRIPSTKPTGPVGESTRKPSQRASE
jgi:hypothetical protein